MTPEQREIHQLKLKLQAADCLAATVDWAVHQKIIDARSAIADARLCYGEPFDAAEAERLMLRTRPPMEREPLSEAEEDKLYRATAKEPKVNRHTKICERCHQLYEGGMCWKCG